MSKDIQITGLERARDPQPTVKGHLILAYFTADIGVFTVKGCALVRTAGGKLAAWLPNLNDAKAKANRYIQINDQPTLDSLLQHALQMYRRMGGTEADWCSRERELPVPFVPKLIPEEALLERDDSSDDGDTSGVARFLGADAA